MTTAITYPQVKPRLVSRPLLLVMSADFGALTSFYLLLSVVPLCLARLGDAGIAAGLSIGLLMAATVIAELVTPRLVARFGYRRVLAAGLVLLGAPALALAAPTSMTTIPVIMVISLVRGVGFAIVMVVAGALVALLVPKQRQGEGLGVHGVVAGLPGMIALPLGLWLVDHAGFTAAFLVGGGAALAGLAALPWVPASPSLVDQPSPAEQPVGILACLRTPALFQPAVLFAGTAMATGIVTGFLPMAVADGSVAAAGLLVQAAFATSSRWAAGKIADRYGAGRLLVPAILAAAAGLVPLIVDSSPALVLAGLAVFGTGFGFAQTASLTLMLRRVAPDSYGTVSALWNIAYDAGWGCGAAGFGVLAAALGYSPAFAVTALVMLLIPMLVRRPSHQVPHA